MPSQCFYIIDTDANVRRCATVLEDTALLAKLAPGDKIALMQSIT